MSEPSLCIPYVFNNISENRIRNVFDELRLGKIKRIDILERINNRGHKYKRVYIHFYKWYNDRQAQEARTRIIAGKDFKIVYDTQNGWFWKVSANKWSEKDNTNKSRPHISFDSSEDDSQDNSDVYEDINPRQIIHDNTNNEDIYVPDYGKITPPKKRPYFYKIKKDESKDDSKNESKDETTH